MILTSPVPDFSSAYRGEGSRDMHVRAWFDDKHRIMVLALHNTRQWQTAGNAKGRTKLILTNSQKRARIRSPSTSFFI